MFSRDAMTPFETIEQHHRFPKEIGGRPFVPKPLQLDAINKLAPLHHQGHFNDMSCVDSDTEYLSPTGWRKISDYVEGPVAQYHAETGMAEFVLPIEYVRKPCDQMISIKTMRGIDQMLSPEHRVLLNRYASEQKEVLSAQALLERHDKWVAGGRSSRLSGEIGWPKACIPSVFKVDGGPGLTFSEGQLRLQVAVIADGHFPPKSGRRCVVRLKKPRKVARMVALLEAAEVGYKVRQNDTATAQGFHVFSFMAPARIKVFDEAWWKASLAQLRTITDEVMHWDGSTSEDGVSQRFSTLNKQSADFVQYAAIASGRNARVLTRLRVDRNMTEYSVQVRREGKPLRLTSVGSDGTRLPVMSFQPSTDGFKYCFIVPTSFLVLRRNGCVFASGNTGKTFMATACALYHRGVQTIVIMPPLLITQWAQWLRLITPALSITEYRGTPKERAALSLDNDFVLVGVQIFKKDYERISKHFKERAVTVIVDEANFVSNIGTDTHEKVYEFCIGRTRMLLTGTPANKPGDAYGLLKFTVPGLYRNKKHFENVHVAERDFFDNPVKWQNLDQLKAALETNAVRILFRDMHSAVDKPLYDPIEYDLSPEHYKLYRKLAEEQLLELPDGGKIDATTSGRMIAKLGQIIVNQDHFSGGERTESTAIDLVEQKLAELGDGKLVVFANYRMTIAALLRRFVKQGARGINSEVSPKQKDANLKAFMEDPSCRLLAVQFISGGKGLDGLQHVCNHCFFIEPCMQPRDFHQAVARLDRLGQKERVWVGMGVAQGTLQVRGFRNLLANDELTNQIIRNATDLRATIFGA